MPGPVAHRRRLHQFGTRAALLAASLLLGLLIGETGLTLSGFPARFEPPATHPAGVVETRRSPEFEYTFQTNEHGLRYNRQHAYCAGQRTTIVLGDSFVEGFGVDDGDRFTDLLEKASFERGDSIRFVNAGIAGSGPLEYSRVLQATAPHYCPGRVLIAVYANDVAGMPGLAEVAGGKKRLLLTIKRLALKVVPRTTSLLLKQRYQRIRARKEHTTSFVDTITREASRRGIDSDRIRRWKAALPADLVAAVDRNEFNGSTMSYGLLYPEYWTESLDIATPRAHAKWAQAKGALSSIVQYGRDMNADVAIIFIPTRLQVEEVSHTTSNPWILGGVSVREAWLNEATALQQRLSSLADSLSVPFLDLAAAMRAHAATNDTLYYPLDGHWTKTGHAAAADTIDAWLALIDPPGGTPMR